MGTSKKKERKSIKIKDEEVNEMYKTQVKNNKKVKVDMNNLFKENVEKAELKKKREKLRKDRF